MFVKFYHELFIKSADTFIYFQNYEAFTLILSQNQHLHLLL